MIITETLQITPQLLNIVAEIDEFKGAWRALGSLAPERLSALRRVATIESVGSSTRIEGSKLSDRDVEALLANLEVGTFTTRDEQEVAGYAAVMETVFTSWREVTFTENHLRQLHRNLLAYSEQDDWYRGQYKTSSNSVAAFDDAGQQIGIVFETAIPFDTPRLTAELIEWLNTAREKRHRAQQGLLLPGVTPNSSHDPEQCTRLAAVAHVFHTGFATADETTGREGRT